MGRSSSEQLFIQKDHKRMSKNHIVNIITDSHSQICPKQFCKVVKYRYNYGNMSFLNQSIKL